jgi:hypothetical protein
MSTQYRLVQSGKTATGSCSAGQGSSEPVAPRIYYLFTIILLLTVTYFLKPRSNLGSEAYYYNCNRRRRHHHHHHHFYSECLLCIQVPRFRCRVIDRLHWMRQAMPLTVLFHVWNEIHEFKYIYVLGIVYITLSYLHSYPFMSVITSTDSKINGSNVTPKSTRSNGWHSCFITSSMEFHSSNLGPETDCCVWVYRDFTWSLKLGHDVFRSHFFPFIIHKQWFH